MLMRKGAILKAVVLMLVIGAVAGISQPDRRVKFEDKYAEVATCKTLAEAERVMGVPPGWHVTTDVGYMGPLDYKRHGGSPSGAKFVDDMASWAGDDCCIFVFHYPDGTIKTTRLVYPLKERSWFKRVLEDIIYK